MKMRNYINIFKIGIPAVVLLDQRNIFPDGLSVTSLYSTICSKFVKSVGETTLKAVPSLDEKDNVRPFQLVVKSTKRYFILSEKAVYYPTEFQITDIMTEECPLETKLSGSTLISNYHRKTKLSLKGQVGVEVSKQIIEAEMEANDTVTLDIKFGKVTKVEVNIPKLTSELKNRYINLEHPYVRQIREDDNKVLCMITGVACLHDGGTISRADDTGASGKLRLDFLKKASVSGDTSYSRDRYVTLPQKTPVAYNVHELNIDAQSGAMQMVLARGSCGGFKENLVRSSNVNHHRVEAELRIRGKLDLDLRHPREIFLPLLQLPEQQRREITEDLLYLLTVPRDLYILADVFEKTEARQLPEMKLSELEDKLLSPAERWIGVLKLVGFQIKNGTLVPPSKCNPLLKCMGEFLDAVTVVDDDDLGLIRLCSRDLAQPLFTVLQQGIKGQDVSDPTIVQPLLRDTISRRILSELRYTLQESKILAPVDLTFSIDEVYWILYALWGKV